MDNISFGMILSVLVSDVAVRGQLALRYGETVKYLAHTINGSDHSQKEISWRTGTGVQVKRNAGGLVVDKRKNKMRLMGPCCYLAPTTQVQKKNTTRANHCKRDIKRADKMAAVLPSIADRGGYSQHSVIGATYWQVDAIFESFHGSLNSLNIVCACTVCVIILFHNTHVWFLIK